MSPSVILQIIVGGKFSCKPNLRAHTHQAENQPPGTSVSCLSGVQHRWLHRTPSGIFFQPMSYYISVRFVSEREITLIGCSGL